MGGAGGCCIAGEVGDSGVEESGGLGRQTMQAANTAMAARRTSKTAPTEVDAVARMSADCESLDA